MTIPSCNTTRAQDQASLFVTVATITLKDLCLRGLFVLLVVVIVVTIHSTQCLVVVAGIRCYFLRITAAFPHLFLIHRILVLFLLLWRLSLGEFGLFLGTVLPHGGDVGLQVCDVLGRYGWQETRNWVMRHLFYWNLYSIAIL